MIIIILQYQNQQIMKKNQINLQKIIINSKNKIISGVEKMKHKEGLNSFH